MLEFNSETVKLPCEPIDTKAAGQMASVRDWAVGMFEIIDKQKGLGLAANQVGRNVQLIVVSCGGFRAAIINPKIERAWGGLHTMAETCLSSPGLPVRLVRHKRVRVTGFDMAGKPITQKAKGILARVFQHEIDHMEGITIQDRFRLGVFG